MGKRPELQPGLSRRLTSLGFCFVFFKGGVGGLSFLNTVMGFFPR